MCLVYLQYFERNIVPVLSHLTYFRHIVTLDSYFPTMSQSTGTLRLAESNIQTALSSTSPTSSPTTGSIPQPSQPPVATNGSQKSVFAHFMVGNTFPYTVDDWNQDIALASASGIDGFALNTGSDSWEPARIADA